MHEKGDVTFLFHPQHKCLSTVDHVKVAQKTGTLDWNK